MTRSLPARPNLENLKKQAKTILKSHSSDDDSACAVLRHLRRFRRSSDQEILKSEVSLTEVQYALAMEYGFPSWNALKEAVKGQEGQTRFLHLHCGDYSAESLRRSGVPGKVTVWYDPFTIGPVPADVAGEEWIALRAGTCLDRFETEADAVRFFGDMYNRLEEFRGFEEVVLWFDACLFDQTILVHHLDWFSRRDMGDTKLSLICVGEFPGMPRFKGLGELRPEQMASLLDTRREVTEEETRLAALAWNAYRAPDPTAIEELLRKDTTALPYLAGAFSRHLQRFPSVRSGLSRLEQESFEVISEGHNVFADVFVRVSDMEDPPFFGDTMLLAQLEELTYGDHPLLRMEGLEFTVGLRRHEWPVKKLSFLLTDTGREVLEGKADLVRLRGIDRWLGGVHLEGREAQWRWDDLRQGLKAAE